MKIDQFSTAAQFAVQSARQIGLLAQTIQGDLAAEKMDKDDLSPVTVADFAGQAVFARALRDRYPDATLVGEEGAQALREDGGTVLDAVTKYTATQYADATKDAVCDWIDQGQSDANATFWTLDPIDGTKGYIRGDQYAVALAYIVNGKVELGVLACPNLGPDCTLRPGTGGALVVAERGNGTWATSMDAPDEFVRLSVSPESALAKARLLRSYVSGHTNTDQLQQVSDVLGLEAEPVALDSQAKYALLAAGHGEMLLRLLSTKQPNYKEKIWDQAAGAIVVEEADGRITDLSGKELDFSQGRSLENNRGICATNRTIHDEVIEVVGKLD